MRPPSLFDRSPLPMWVVARETLDYLEANAAAVKRYGYTREEWLGRTIMDIRPPSDVAVVERVLAAGEDPQQVDWRHITKHGELLDVAVLLEEISFEDRPAWIVVALDISARKRIEADAEQRAAQQAGVAKLGAAALEGMPVSELMDLAVTVVAQTLGARFSELLEVDEHHESLLLQAGVGWREGLVRKAQVPFGSRFYAGFTFGSLGRVVVEDFATERRFEPTALLREHDVVSGACVIVGRKGRPFGVLGVHTDTQRSFKPDEVDFLQAVANVLADAIDRQQAEDQIRHQALHDAVTGLPNRTLLLERLGHWLGRARRHRSTAAVFFLDVDNFKLINDTLGHEAGDQLLLGLAHRLQPLLRTTDTLARLGGDEFVILCEDLLSEHAALELVERFLEALEEPFTLGTTRRAVTASIGVVVADHKAEAEGLIRSADAAMYRAKERGGARYELFDDEMRERSRRWTETERELRRAVDSGELFNLYQPIVSTEEGRLVGFEALVRWRHPSRGVVPPAEFIGIAEQTGLIVAVGEAVLSEACEKAAGWQQTPGGAGLRIAVNLSPRQVADPSLVSSVEGILERTGLDPDLLSLEITETVLIEDPDATLDTLNTLKQLGVRLVLDDFGTGYSSLTHVKRFPIDLLKIDRSFVAGLGQDQGDSAIVTAVLSMARAVGIGAVAEGVETVEQAAQLRSLGCPLAQGYLYARPLAATAADQLVEGSLGELALPAS